MVCIMGKSIKMDVRVGRELFSIILAKYTRESLRMMLKMGKGSSNIQMVLFILGILLMAKEMVKVDFNGQMDKSMMVNGKII